MARRTSDLSRRRPKKKPVSSKHAENLAMGEPPAVPEIGAEHYQAEIGAVYNWYSRRYSTADERKEAKEWVVEWMKSQDYSTADVRAFKASPLKMTTSSMATNARILLDGRLLPRETVERFREAIGTAIEYREKPRDEKPTTGPTIQEKTREVQSNLIGEVLGMIDDDPKLDLYRYLQSNQVKAAHARAVCAKLLSTRDELAEAVRGECPQLKEAYSHLDRAGLRSLHHSYVRLCEECDRHVGNTKAMKVPKAKKEKPAQARVSKVVYLKMDKELQLVSVDPVNVVGAMHLWTYNTKYKTLVHYVSRESTGFKVRGTTIQNFDVDESEQRALRKPDKTLKELLSATPAGMKKVMVGLTTKSAKPNGRINENTILLRASK